jgi:ABC-type taurine transport system substrate-binding protein
LRDKKSSTDHWYNIAKVNGVNKEEFSKALESQTFYTMEEVFVQDRLTWENAKSEK